MSCIAWHMEAMVEFRPTAPAQSNMLFTTFHRLQTMGMSKRIAAAKGFIERGYQCNVGLQTVDIIPATDPMLLESNPNRSKCQRTLPHAQTRSKKRIVAHHNPVTRCFRPSAEAHIQSTSKDRILPRRMNTAATPSLPQRQLLC